TYPTQFQSIEEFTKAILDTYNARALEYQDYLRKTQPDVDDYYPPLYIDCRGDDVDQTIDLISKILHRTIITFVQSWDIDAHYVPMRDGIHVYKYSDSIDPIFLHFKWSPETPNLIIPLQPKDENELDFY
ncbi:MAG: hypothetical protein ACYCPT_06970, partial [Acidimicrobiales bacterium]